MFICCAQLLFEINSEQPDNNVLKQYIVQLEPGKIGSICRTNLENDFFLQQSLHSCTVLNSFCLNGICECLPMYRPNGLNECLLIDNGILNKII